MPKTEARAYRYYIGYMCIQTGEVGGTNIKRTVPIRNDADVIEVQEFLRRDQPRWHSLIVTAFSLYADED